MSLHLSKYQIVGNHMSRLNYVFCLIISVVIDQTDHYVLSDLGPFSV